MFFSWVPVTLKELHSLPLVTYGAIPRSLLWLFNTRNTILTAGLKEVPISFVAIFLFTLGIQIHTREADFVC